MKMLGKLFSFRTVRDDFGQEFSISTEPREPLYKHANGEVWNTEKAIRLEGAYCDYLKLCYHERIENAIEKGDSTEFTEAWNEAGQLLRCLLDARMWKRANNKEMENG